MKTTLTTFLPDGTSSSVDVDLPERPGLDAIRAALRPIFGEEYTEHVAVLHEGERRDMFVDETGQLKGLPRNEAATTIYRANWMSQHPSQDPETLPDIVGPAVLVSRRIWF